MNKTIQRGYKRILGSLALSLIPMTMSMASDTYPEKPVRIVVGFSAGGTTDVLARLVGKELSETLGQSFVVENKPGAGSNIGTEEVKRAKGDGYTLLMMAITSTINQSLYKNVKFDINKDFDPVVLVAKIPNVLIVNPSAPFHSVSELVDYAKANPEKVIYGSSGSGSSIHLAAELFKQQAGIDMLHIPFNGSAPALTALLGGQTHLNFENMPAAAPHIRSGKLKAFAVTTAQRSDTFPDVPTLKELGYPEYNLSSWFGLVAPAGTPKEIREKINQVVHNMLKKPDVQEKLKGLGVVFEPNTPEQFGQFISSEINRWSDVVKQGNISVD
ncbi:tripartite tricarboxylate transporter substrate binding protein [Pelistega suis]|uniref:Tripartite tricarboxylate transporter substrate binding protein n=1 Tax=Pelistega suis TaxID=1631957 RepID=A0A849NYB2_9BURK|nr:tripartite tricarboxylate transporter substrate binding protein [Pelistega suis]